MPFLCAVSVQLCNLQTINSSDLSTIRKYKTLMCYRVICFQPHIRRNSIDITSLRSTVISYECCNIVVHNSNSIDNKRLALIYLIFIRDHQYSHHLSHHLYHYYHHPFLSFIFQSFFSLSLFHLHSHFYSFFKCT